MAKRLSVKEMLEAARKGPAKPAELPTPRPHPPRRLIHPPSNRRAGCRRTDGRSFLSQPRRRMSPPPASLGRPLTLKEKLAAARPEALPPAGAPAAQTSCGDAGRGSPRAGAQRACPKKLRPSPNPAAPAVPAPAPSLGRPMTLKEKLAAARAGGRTRRPGWRGETCAAEQTGGRGGEQPAAQPSRPRLGRSLLWTRSPIPRIWPKPLRQSSAKSQGVGGDRRRQGRGGRGSDPGPGGDGGQGGRAEGNQAAVGAPKPSKAAAGVATAATTQACRFVVGPVGLDRRGLGVVRPRA